ncbi:RNA polymerase sigma factor [Candidatus Peregrinibacteria bacterium]|nr:RNA polymerase sigma factor [Candidatus Peregrinibacteria bacterium]
MDLYVEKQWIDQIKEGNIKQFLLLFDAVFADLYRYVVRRVGGGAGEIAERIVRLTFLDAMGQAQVTPTDTAYVVWLYSLARPRVWEEINRSSFPERQGLIDAVDDGAGVAGSENGDILVKVEKMMKKLSLEEREIFRLKFFEEVSDGDVMTILAVSEGAIGSKIYRVLKRAHFLLFGESDERQGVYFGELTGLLSQVRELEKIEIPEVFRLSLRADLSARIDRKEFAVESELVEEEVDTGPKEPPVMVMDREFKGSSDPAKIFVEAVKEMREEEEAQKARDHLKFQREEHMFDFVERWRWMFTVVPTLIFLGLVTFFVVKIFFVGGPVLRGYPTACKIEVAFKGDFSDGEKRNVNQGVSDKICGHFEVSKLLITRLDDGKVQVNVDAPQWMLEYKFVKKSLDWRIKEYARTLSGDEKSGKV